MLLQNLKTASPYKKSQFAFFGAAIITLMVLGAWGVTLGDRLATEGAQLSASNDSGGPSFSEVIGSGFSGVTESFAAFGESLELLTGTSAEGEAGAGAESEFDANALFETGPAEENTGEETIE